MKINSLYAMLLGGAFIAAVSSCRNQDIEFDDYDFSAVYFAHQSPVRTLVMGEDTYDTSLDNEHKCQIYATMGGVYSNDKKISIDVEVDNSLCDNLYFDTEYKEKVEPMPLEYYSLSSNQIILDKKLLGAVDVQFTDKFFEDENALKNTYVIPLKMIGVENADSILFGRTDMPDAPLTNTGLWSVAPKNYVLYCVKYINTWEGNYLRRGKDVIDGTEEVIRHEEYVEEDEIFSVKTKNLNTAIMSVTSSIGEYELELVFDENNNCTVQLPEGSNYSLEGDKNGGTFVKDGDKNSWGNKDRDVLYLDYTIKNHEGNTCHTLDTLVMRDRGVAYEVFTPNYKN